MSSDRFNILALPAYEGLLLERVYRSPLSWFIYTAVAGVFALPILYHADYIPLIVYIFLLGFAMHILSTFNKDVLYSNAHKEPETTNLAWSLSSDVVRKLAKEREINSYSLVRAAVETSRGQFILNELGVSESEFMARCSEHRSKSFDLREVMVKLKSFREQVQERKVDANVILFAFFQYNPLLKQLLNDKDLSLEDLSSMMKWERFHHDWDREMNSWSPSRLVNTFGTIGRSWVMGYTVELDKYVTDLSGDIIRTGKKKVTIHKKEMGQMMHVLERSDDQNVLVLGKKGVGKQTLIRNITYALRTHELQKALPLTRVTLLNTSMLLASSQNPDKVLLDALSAAKKAGKFIFVIDNLATLLQSNNPNVIAVLTRFLKAKNISLIAVADTQDYHVLVKKNPTLDNLFEKITVNDANEEETMGCLMSHYFRVEQHKHMHITYKALKTIYELAQRYIGKTGFPGKAIAVMDDAVQAARHRGDKFVTGEDVREMISLKAHIDVREISQDEKEKLIHLEEEIQHVVFGQDRAIAVLVNALKRAKLDIHEGTRPLGTFLFLGPTGVGKTQTAKTLAKYYFGSTENMIRLDMNEYGNPDSVKMLIGSPESSDALSEGFLARRVQDQPFSLILLDEIEKADKSVLNVFLQILDEGTMIDGLGMQTDFRNTIIIATSNAGAQFISEVLRKEQELDKDAFKKELINHIIDQGIFAPEFVNRFDEVILYHPLTHMDAKNVAIQMVGSVVNEFKKKKGISVLVSEDALEGIVEKGYSQEFGAREMRRVVTDLIETFLADYLLKNDVQRGDEIHIQRSDLRL